MKRTLLKLAAASVLLSCTTAPTWAHHSFASVFDPDKPITLQGTVVEVRLENPHSWFVVDIKGANGKIERWNFEASNSTSLIRLGLKPGVVKAGDTVTIKGWRAKDPSQTIGFISKLILANGRVFQIGPSVAPGV